MSANRGCGSDEIEVSPHGPAIAAYGEALALVHDADVASVRALAELGRSALREARRDGVRGMASDMELRSVAAEAAGLARRTDRRLQADIDHALTIVDDYPTVFSAWEERRITRDHVDAVVKAGTGLPDEVRGEFEVAAIAVCERDIATRVKPALRALAEKLHERTFTDRHREAAAGRCVRVAHGTDGMSDVIATVPTVIAVGMLDRLTQMGQLVKDARADAAGACEPADTRTMDQLRADILGDLVLGGAPVVDPTYGTDRAGGLGAIRARVQVAVTAETLMGRDENPAEAVGAGLVDADTVRQLAGQVSEWDRLFIDPLTRTPVEIDTYRPTASMKKLLMARDQHCRFPGCRRAAIRCELDHTIDYALGGHTHIFNLAHLCQRHHSMKQFTKWEVRQVGGGVLEWTSPLGRVYREDVPIPAVCFTMDTADPPPDAALGGPPPGQSPPF
ncbi:HNH endonuclease [Microbacterium sp. 1262]|uniref:HNH endonuclease signature motif containing protein n=1 Tax=Microbacterium sp. 1262 TaxID=3156415 RepID=UPI0033950162